IILVLIKKKIKLTNKDNISENETNISQENKENDIETDDKPNFSQKYKIPEDKSISTLKKHFEKKYKNTITTKKIIRIIDKFIKKEKLIFTQENCYNDLINWIISDNQSFIVVENNFFQTMIKRLNNIVKIPSTNTISNKIVKLYNDKQINLQKKLQEILGKISYILDTWTSKNQKSFIGITAY
ncbi:16682_t:CDS:2, partial [Cetraspora pellucida]